MHDLPAILKAMANTQVNRALCISTTLEEFPQYINWLCRTPICGPQPVFTRIAKVSGNPIWRSCWHWAACHGCWVSAKPGLTTTGSMVATWPTSEWQRNRFRTHIRAARQFAKPLVIHTRNAAMDTLAILREAGEDGSAGSAGGVFHCFTEDAPTARAALDLGFYISFSGILTFKSAQTIRDVATFVPLDRLLIETDSPYLAPVPHRGKTNNPSFVPLVAAQLAQLKQMPIQQIARLTSDNFDTLFKGVCA